MSQSFGTQPKRETTTCPNCEALLLRQVEPAHAPWQALETSGGKSVRHGAFAIAGDTSAILCGGVAGSCLCLDAIALELRPYHVDWATK
jgi:hypothetical protein